MVLLYNSQIWNPFITFSFAMNKSTVILSTFRHQHSDSIGKWIFYVPMTDHCMLYLPSRRHNTSPIDRVGSKIYFPWKSNHHLLIGWLMSHYFSRTWVYHCFFGLLFLVGLLYFRYTSLSSSQKEKKHFFRKLQGGPLPFVNGIQKKTCK